MAHFLLPLLKWAGKRASRTNAAGTARPAIGIYTRTSNVSIWEEDLGEVKAELDRLAARGISDFRSYFDARPESVAELMDRVRIVDVNEATLRIFGANDKAALIGSMERVLLPETQRVFVAQLVAMAEARPRFKADTAIRTLQGERRDVMFSIVFPPAGATFRNVLVTLTDISDRKRAERSLRASEEQLRLVTDHAPALIVHCDAKLRYKYVNASYAERYGLTPDEIVGRRVEDVVGPRAFQQLRPYATAALKGERVEFEDLVYYDGIGPRWVHCVYVPERDASGSVTGYFTVLHDVTQRKQMEEALRRADRLKDEFLATLSHELRNPLAPLRSGIDILRVTHAPSGPDRSVLDMMDRQVGHLVRLVDDLLEVARISQGAFELHKERIELASVVANAVEASEPLIEAGGHTLHVDLPPAPVWLEADSVRLAQILSNLLNNAAKYTDAGGRIDLAAERRGGTVRISVRDTGIGFAPEAGLQLFVMFGRAHGAEGRRPGGLGIGLALARRLTEMHGGTIEAHSEGPGRGSEFSVQIPIGHPAPPPKTERRAASAAPPKRRILVVDDNEDAAESIALLLTQLGAAVRAVHSGFEALEAFRAEPADIVLLDIGMPEMDGYETARRLRSEFPDHETLVVALSGWGQETDRRRAREAGFDRHLIKPADAAALEALLGTG